VNVKGGQVLGALITLEDDLPSHCAIGRAARPPNRITSSNSPCSSGLSSSLRRQSRWSGGRSLCSGQARRLRSQLPCESRTRRAELSKPRRCVWFKNTPEKEFILAYRLMF
jgi:hypothetical protein